MGAGLELENVTERGIKTNYRMGQLPDPWNWRIGLIASTAAFPEAPCRICPLCRDVQLFAVRNADIYTCTRTYIFVCKYCKTNGQMDGRKEEHSTVNETSLVIGTQFEHTASVWPRLLLLREVDSNLASRFN